MSGNKYKLIYFNGRGRAETIRLELAALGMKYEDKRIEFADWPALKATTPWGGIPILEVEGKGTIGQSMAIARFLAREHNLAGKTSFEQAHVDAIVDTYTELREKGVEMKFEKDEARKGQLLEKLKETSAQIFAASEKLVKGDGWFVGKEMTLADIHFFAICNQLILSSGNTDMLKPFPKLHALYEKVAKNPKIAEYLKKRPETAF